MYKAIGSFIAALLLSSSAFASGGHYDGYERGGGYGYGRGHHHHHHHRDRDYYPGPVYFAPPGYVRDRVVYIDRPVPVAPPPVRYYQEEPSYYQAPPPRYYRQSYGSPSGALGSAIGGVVGYQAGNGDPLAAGIGAAAGSMIGNAIHRH